MPKSIVASSPEEIMDTKVDERPSRDEGLTQSQNRASDEMMLASRPRICDSTSELARAVLGTGPGDSEESQYCFTLPPGTTSQSVPTNTVVHLRHDEIKNDPGMKGQEEVPQYEIKQNGAKFKGNVRSIKIIATQVTSGIQDSGVFMQSGALFFQSVTDSDADVNQSVSVGRKKSCNVKQDSFEVEGEAIESKFTWKQNVWEKTQCQCPEPSNLAS